MRSFVTWPQFVLPGVKFTSSPGVQKVRGLHMCTRLRGLASCSQSPIGTSSGVGLDRGQYARLCEQFAERRGFSTTMDRRIANLREEYRNLKASIDGT